jgi:glucose dehydrogenase
MKRIVTVGVISGLLAGCSVFDRGPGPRTPTVGNRIGVLTTDTPIEVDAELAATPVTVPAPIPNTDWPQPGGNPAKSMTHVNLGANPTRLWSVSIGSGSTPAGRLASEPVVAGGRVYTIDTQAVVRAFDANTGSRVWEARVRGEQVSSRACSAAASASTTAGSMSPTAPAMPRLSMLPPASSCGWCVPAGRSAVRPPWRPAASM